MELTEMQKLIEELIKIEVKIIASSQSVYPQEEIPKSIEFKKSENYKGYLECKAKIQERVKCNKEEVFGNINEQEFLSYLIGMLRYNTDLNSEKVKTTAEERLRNIINEYNHLKSEIKLAEEVLK